MNAVALLVADFIPLTVKAHIASRRGDFVLSVPVDRETVKVAGADGVVGGREGVENHALTGDLQTHFNAYVAGIEDGPS